MPPLIGIYSPYPRSGKSTFAQALIDLVPNSVNVKFADGFREITLHIVGEFFGGGEAEAHEWLQDDRKDTRDIPTLNVTLRHVLQSMGAWGRNAVHPHLWAMLAENKIIRSHNRPLVVVDDLRYENEYHMLKKRGACLIRIERPNSPRAHEHESNARLERLPWDYQLINAGSREDLRVEARYLLNDYGVPCENV